MKNRFKVISVIIIVPLIILSCSTQGNHNQFVNRFIGTGGHGGIVPVAAVPFGMVQLGPDTRTCGSGYDYYDETILGFSHIHKSGAGCSDFLDILFLPLDINTRTDNIKVLNRGQFETFLSHEKESSKPGYYEVNLYEDKVKVKLTATLRCGFQNYSYSELGEKAILLDLEHGSDCGCSIIEEQDIDTILLSSFEMVDDYTIRGSRISSGFAPEQHVYFHTVFSQPMKKCVLYVDNQKVDNAASAAGVNIKAIITFEENIKNIDVKTGISPVDVEGARKNLFFEINNKSFEKIQQESNKKWATILSQIEIETNNNKKEELFYTALFNVMMYPTLFSDVDNRYRGPDREVHQTDGYSYYGGVMGFWDTFRAAIPLQSILQPLVIEDYVKTTLDHFKYAGQLPIWTLAGVESYQMIGLSTMPVITNAYMNGITSFDVDYAMEAMQVSAMKDTCGYSMNYFVGLKNYKKYGFVPCNLEMESVARTMEYSFNDRAIAQFAKLTNHENDYNYFYNRSFSYKNVIDTSTLFARGRTSDGKWRTPFNPLKSAHRRDDYCEGNAWQWTFFVPHDIDGLANLIGGRKVLLSRLDSLFTMHSRVEGKYASGDITGMIGQYAHGNEPSHHIAYMYNYLGKPRKTQYYVNEILATLYHTTPDGICGDEDTGQLSAWYIFSSLGFYPMDPVSGNYELGAPLFDKAIIKLPSGKSFTVTANNLSDENIYVKDIYLNNEKLNRSYITFEEVLNGGNLHFEMTN